MRWERTSLNTRPASVAAGILAAAVLYGIFFVGNAIAPYIVPGAQGQVGGIYALGSGTERALIFLLLCFVTGPGEEVFWRGFLQGRLMDRWGPGRGFVLTTLIYGAVHVFGVAALQSVKDLAVRGINDIQRTPTERGPRFIGDEIALHAALCGRRKKPQRNRAVLPRMRVALLPSFPGVSGPVRAGFSFGSLLAS